MTEETYDGSSSSATTDSDVDAALRLAFLSGLDAAGDAAVIDFAIERTWIEGEAWVGPGSSTEAEVAPLTQDSSTFAAELEATGRYRIRGEIGAGGMGVVLGGLDTKLGREVAVKVLPEPPDGYSRRLERFVEEAQIASQLQHPGIVPIFDVGLLGESRPYFTMQFVKGRDLRSILRARLQPTDDAPSNLGAFRRVCEAMAYAHARGVIHRDLKPSNIMIGDYGEVFVVDWGLAKVVRGGHDELDPTPDPAPSGDLNTVRARASAFQSEVGAVVGTPAYMSPEQARGEIDALDARCDVFSLGAILFEILTNSTPYEGDGSASVKEAAARGDLKSAWARLEASGGDPELVALSRACLAPGRGERLASAGEIATRLRDYTVEREERARRAESDLAAAQARAREERRVRRLTTALAVAVVALVLVAGGVVLWTNHQRQKRIQETTLRVSEAWKTVYRTAESANSSRTPEAWEAAVKALQDVMLAAPIGSDDRVRATARLANANDKLSLARARFKVESHDAATCRRFDELNRDRIRRIPLDELDRRYRVAMIEAGVRREEPPGFLLPKIHGSAIHDRIIAALHEWALVRMVWKTRDWKVLAKTAEIADKNPFRRGVVRAAIDDDVVELRRLLRRSDAGELPAATWEFVANVVAHRHGAATGLEFFRMAWPHHGDNFMLNFGIAYWSQELEPRDLETARAHFAAAVAIEPASVAASYNLGFVLLRLGEFERAEQELRRLPHQDNWRVPYYLGRTYRSLKRTEDALTQFLEAAAAAPDESFPMVGVGDCHRDLGDLRSARDAYRRAFVAEHPMSYAVVQYGRMEVRLGRPAEARRVFRAGLEKFPKDGALHFQLGRTLLTVDRAQGLEHMRLAYEFDPKLGAAAYTLGTVAYLAKRYDEAEGYLRRAVKRRPDDPRSHINYAQVLRGLNRYEEGLTYLERATKLSATTPVEIPLDDYIASCRKEVELERRWKNIVAGRYIPKNAGEWIDVARHLASRSRWLEEARLWKTALGWQPDLATIGPPSYVVRGARVASRAVGDAKVWDSLDASTREKWLTQAVDWLEAEWRNVREAVAAGRRVDLDKTVRYWLNDPWLGRLIESEPVDSWPQPIRERIEGLFDAFEDMLEDR